MSGRRASTAEGFSLLELTTAFFLLTTCAFGMVQMFHVGVWSARAANERQIALRAIQNELETLRATPLGQIAIGNALPFISHTPELETLRLAKPELTVEVDSALPLLHIRATIRWITENGRPTSASLEMLLARSGRTSTVASPSTPTNVGRSPTDPTNVIPAKAGTLGGPESPHP
ncbi:MAG: hypothetical protein AAB353_04435 [Candidatus Hydrogenedentota bacterium]